jgi:o-succinylbenzoate---CoA ligase
MDWLAMAAAERPSAPALITGERTISYAELDRAANGVASIVVGGGLEGESVALPGERTDVVAAALWGIPRARGTAMPIDPHWPAAQAMHLTRASGVRGLFDSPRGGFDRLLARGSFTPPAWGPPHPGSTFVVFTSGSEGGRKGVILTGANIAASVAGSRSRVGNGADDEWLCVLPLFHVGGLSIMWRQAEAGAPVRLEGGFDPQRVSRALGAVAFASMVPTMLRRVLDAGVGGGAIVIVGGGPVAPDLIERAVASGLVALQSYGMTETTSQVCTVAPGDVLDDLGTAGRPIAGAEVRVMADGAPVVGGEGRIEVRGAMVSPGYLGEPARAEGAWFTTGDLGILDAGGRLSVLGRADGVIVTGGENVHPAQVEHVLHRHPAVTRARVLGEPDDEWGSRVVAEVVAAGATGAEVLDWARAHLSPAQVPKEVRVVDALDEKMA